MHFLPTHVDEHRGINNLPRKFHFWSDILPFMVWKLENKLSLDLHLGRKFVKIYLSMRDRIASRLDSNNSVNGSNNHG